MFEETLFQEYIFDIIKEYIDKDVEEQIWNEIADKLQYNGNVDPYVIISYYKNEPYWYNEIETFYLSDREWKVND